MKQIEVEQGDAESSTEFDEKVKKVEEACRVPKIELDDKRQKRMAGEL